MPTRTIQLALTTGLLAATFTSVAIAQDAPATAPAPTQAEQRKNDAAEPLSLEQAPAKNAASQDSGGFWMFPSPAPTTGPIATDRPGFSDSAGLVARGHFQLETGYTLTYDRNDDKGDPKESKRISDHRFPELALRTGLTDWLEFRLGWTGWSLTETLGPFTTPGGRHITHEDHVDGGTDMNVGLKFRLLQQNGWAPNLSMITTLSVPTGEDAKSFNNVVPEIKFPWNYAINQQITIYGSVLGRVPDTDQGQFFQTAATLAAGYHANDWLTLYVEYFGLYNANHHEDAAHILSAGPIIKITDNISLDGRVAVGLNEQSPNFQASIGMGFRF